MTVRELIELLEDYPDDYEVRLMTQPSWPFENSIAGVISTSEMDNEDEKDEPTDPDADVVYITEGGQLGYGRKAAWR